MSWEPWRRVRDAVLRNPSSPLSATERLVAVVVADSMDDAGKAQLSVALISARSGLSRRTVQRALAKLTLPGAIFTETTGGSRRGSERTRSIYQLSTGAKLAQVLAPSWRGSDQRHSDTSATVSPDQRHSGAEVGPKIGPNTAPLRVAARVVRKTKPRGEDAGWVRQACEDWNSRFGAGSAQGGRIAGGLRDVVRANGWPTIRPAWQRYLRDTKHPSPSAQDFAAHWSDWRATLPREQRPEPTAPVCIGERSFK